MAIDFIKQFGPDPLRGFHFDAYAQVVARKKVRDFNGGQWDTANIDGLTILLLPCDGDELTMSAAYNDVTADRLTVSAAFTCLLVNWFWNQFTESLTDEQNQKFHNFYFGLRNAVYADKKTHTIDTSKYFDLTD